MEKMRDVTVIDFEIIPKMNAVYVQYTVSDRKVYASTSVDSGKRSNADTSGVSGVSGVSDLSDVSGVSEVSFGERPRLPRRRLQPQPQPLSMPQPLQLPQPQPQPQQPQPHAQPLRAVHDDGGDDGNTSGDDSDDNSGDRDCDIADSRQGLLWFLKDLISAVRTKTSLTKPINLGKVATMLSHGVDAVFEDLRKAGFMDESEMTELRTALNAKDMAKGNNRRDHLFGVLIAKWNELFPDDASKGVALGHLYE